MTAKHQTPEWRRTCRVIREQVRLAWKRGEPVTCWRCGYEIPEGTAYDVGHLNVDGGQGLNNAAPEHRTRSPWCLGNRAHGGRIGARITNARKQARTNGLVKPTWA